MPLARIGRRQVGLGWEFRGWKRKLGSEEGFLCWRCQAPQPPRRDSCWSCGAIQLKGGYPRRIDEDGEFCDDPACEDCDDYWDDDLDGESDTDLESDLEAARQKRFSLHPSQLAAASWEQSHALMMHPAAQACSTKVGLLPRVFAEFLSIVIWWLVVVIGFFIAMFLYSSPPEMLMVGLTLVPVLGETVLTAELGVTPGKFLTGLRVRSGDSNPGLSRAIIRTFVIVVPFLPMYARGTVGDIAFIVGMIWMLVLMVSIATDPEHRGLHDRIAGTTVVPKVTTRT